MVINIKKLIKEIDASIMVELGLFPTVEAYYEFVKQFEKEEN